MKYDKYYLYYLTLFNIEKTEAFPIEHDKRHREPADKQHRGIRGEGAGDVRGEAHPPHDHPGSPLRLRACGHLRHA